MSEQLNDKVYYINIVNILSPICGNISKGKIHTGEDWKYIMVYPIGNCGIQAMFEEVKDIEIKSPQ